MRRWDSPNVLGTRYSPISALVLIPCLVLIVVEVDHMLLVGIRTALGRRMSIRFPRIAVSKGESAQGRLHISGLVCWNEMVETEWHLPPRKCRKKLILKPLSNVEDGIRW